MKLIFEVMVKEKKHKSSIKGIKSVISYIFNILTTTLCSSIVYVPMVRSDHQLTPKDPNADNTFLSTCSYFMLMMIEHIILVGTTIPKTESLGQTFKLSLYIVPVLLWIFALLFLVLYYKFLHRSTTTGMIGPKLKASSVDFHSIMCCDVRHCSINLCPCVCTSKRVEYCDSKCKIKLKKSLDFKLNPAFNEPTEI